MGFLLKAIKKQFEEHKPGPLKAEILMISGCEDAQTSADISCTSAYQLPDPAGRSGGACTSTLLNVLYKDEANPRTDLSFVQVLEEMRKDLKARGFSQVPQLTSSKPLDVNHVFDLVPAASEAAGGTRRALLIGINYVGHEQGVLSGCQNDALHMKKYIQDVHGFQEQNMEILMDDGKHKKPTKDNMIAAFKKIVADAQPGDSLFIHYSGHGGKLRDDDRGEEEDGFDETLIPCDYQQNGQIRDDDLFDILIKPMKEGVTLTCLMDCCHSGTVLDLPYTYKPGGDYKEMEIDEKFNFDKFCNKMGTKVIGHLLK